MSIQTQALKRSMPNQQTQSYQLSMSTWTQAQLSMSKRTQALKQSMGTLLSVIKVNMDTSSARMFQQGPNYSITIIKAESTPTNLYLKIFVTS